MWRDGGCLSKRKERQNGVEVSLPACAYIMVTRARSGCGANKKMAHDHDQLARRATFVDVVQKIHSQRHALTISFSEKDKFFLWLSLCQSTGKKLDLLGQWTLKKRLAGATSEPIPSYPSCACDWEHLDVVALPGSCPAMGYMHFSCSHLCHLSLPLFLDSLINNGGFV